MNLRGKEVIIAGNGKIPSGFQLKSEFKNNVIFVAVNGGTKHIIKQNLLPHIIIGDLDSLSSSARSKVLHYDIPVITYPRDKDATDLELALQYVINMVPKEIILIGALGGRWDQSFANICLLEKCVNKQIKCRIVDGQTTIRLINKDVTFKASFGEIVSLQPLSTEVIGINTKGLKFPLKNAALYWFASRGISNVTIKPYVKISIENGSLLIFHTKKKKTHSPGG